MPENVLLSEIEVTIGGALMPNQFQNDLMAATIENSLHLPDVATLVLYDSELTWIDDARLAVGKPLKVLLAAAGLRQQVFDGEIVEIEPDFDQDVQRLTIRGFDRMHRLARGRHVRSFINVSDSDLLQSLANEVGLQTVVDPAPLIYPYVFQNNETNLTFLQKRAAALGYLLYVRGQTLYCQHPRSEQTIALEWGADLIEFHPRLTTVEQKNDIMVRGWDPMQKQAIMGQVRSAEGIGAPAIGQPGNGGSVAQSAFGMDAQTLIADRPVRTQALADQLARAAANQQAGSFIEAEGICLGNPQFVAGVAVEITKVGQRFSGTYFVTNTIHTYSVNNGYTTQFSISGYVPSFLLSQLARKEAQGVNSGLVIGIVTDNQDPEGHGRVKVKYPWLSDTQASDWARVATPGGGAQRGIEFLPEINDEVLVGFEMGDIHYPYILGGLWNGRDSPPAQVTDGGQVQKRIIRSRTGHTITLDDSDDGGGIIIEDKNGNKVSLNSSDNQLSITVQGDANIQAQGNVAVKAQGDMTMEAMGQIQVKGNGVAIDGGAAEVEVKGLNVNIKGTMINLN